MGYFNGPIRTITKLDHVHQILYIVQTVVFLVDILRADIDVAEGHEAHFTER